MTKYICCFLRATHAINNIYKLISFLNYYLLFFFMKTTKRPRLHDSDPYSNFLSAMHGFRDNDALLPTGHDVIISPPPEGASRNFS